MIPGSVVRFPEERLELLRQFEKEVATTDSTTQVGMACRNRYNELFRRSITEAGDIGALYQLRGFKAPNEKAEACLNQRITKLQRAVEDTARKSNQVDRRPGGNWKAAQDLAQG
jgi:hypothetical protein